MNKIFSYIMCFFITIILVLFMFISFKSSVSFLKPYYHYQVYLDGEKIGMVDSKDELYPLINKEQKEIKSTYNVEQVYPPKGFQIIKTNTYSNEVDSAQEIYEKIKKLKQFTIKGYSVAIKNSEYAEPIYVYLNDESLLNEAIESFISTFVGNDRFYQYQNNMQNPITDTGFIIENMYFKDLISIKEAYINVDEKIYTDAMDLAKFLMFGDTEDYKEYTVTQGDTIENIAFTNELNPIELIMVNDDLKSEDTLLAIGQKLNVAPINPVLNLVYEELVVEDVEDLYSTKYVEDSTQYVGYKKVKTKGVNGVSRITSRVQFTNGNKNSGAVTVGTPVVIKNTIDEVVVKGTKKKSSGSHISGQYVDTGDAWGWPTNKPYVITSGYGWRVFDRAFHDGIDISGTGRGSPIYAVMDGVVYSSQFGGIVGNSSGCNVVLQHANGYYTIYAHMKGKCSGGDRGCKVCDKVVSAGQTVKRGQQIGYMGYTGTATGTHLHFGVFYGKPYNGGYRVNPWNLYK